MKLPSVRKYLPAYILALVVAVVLAGRGYTWLRPRLRFWPLPPGTIVTIAGTGCGARGLGIEQAEALQDGVRASRAPLAEPSALAIDAAGNLFVLDFPVRAVRKIDRRDIVTTAIRAGASGGQGAGPGQLPGAPSRPAAGGAPANMAPPDMVTGIAVSAASDLIVVESFPHVVLRLRRDGSIQTIAGRQMSEKAWERYNDHPWAVEGGPATRTPLLAPQQAAIDAEGDLFITDTSDNRIVRVDPKGQLTVVAGLSGPIDRAHIRGGLGGGAFSGDGGPAIKARLNMPYGVAVDRHGNMFFADTGNFRVRRIDARGIITTVAGTGPSGRSADGRTISRPTGDGGPAVRAGLESPSFVAVDAEDNAFIVDGPTIRKVDRHGIITTIAGHHSDPTVVPDQRYTTDSTPGTIGDDGPAALAKLNGPRGICIDAEGNLYVATGGGGYVRKIVRAAARGLLAGRPLPSLAKP